MERGGGMDEWMEGGCLAAAWCRVAGECVIRDTLPGGYSFRIQEVVCVRVRDGEELMQVNRPWGVGIPLLTWGLRLVLSAQPSRNSALIES